LQRSAVQLGERVWIYPPNKEHLEPTIAWVATGKGVVVIDAGNSPEHGRRALRAIRETTAEPIRYLINTHRHWDHTFGNQALRAPIIAHALCRRKMEQNARDDWAPDKILGWVEGWVLAHVPTLHLAQFEGLRLVLPEITFTGTLQLVLGSTRFELIYLGEVHSHDSIGVHLPQDRLLFLSDALYFRPDQIATKRVRRLFDKIEALGAETFIAGHERPYDQKQLQLKRRRVTAPNEER
jgi:glyoxylase-like metal-dependent hydrolase (beta-lactamase superfamily II)